MVGAVEGVADEGLPAAVELAACVDEPGSRAAVVAGDADFDVGVVPGALTVVRDGRASSLGDRLDPRGPERMRRSNKGTGTRRPGQEASLREPGVARAGPRNRRTAPACRSRRGPRGGGLESVRTDVPPGGPSRANREPTRATHRAASPETGEDRDWPTSDHGTKLTRFQIGRQRKNGPRPDRWGSRRGALQRARSDI